MNGLRPPWWREVDEAAQLLTSTLQAAVGRAENEGTYRPPRGHRPPRRARRPASLRHLAEIITAEGLAPGIAVDKDIVAAALRGDLRYLTNPTVVVAVLHAAHVIAGQPFRPADRERLTVACDRLAALVEGARDADSHAPQRVPAHPSGKAVAIPQAAGPPQPLILQAYPPRRRRGVATIALTAVVLLAAASAAVVFWPDTDTRSPVAAADTECRLGAQPADIISATDTFDDDAATRLTPTLDFDQMNGSARYARHQGRTFYWGRAGSDDESPAAGGARIRWRTPTGSWRSCRTVLAVTERGYVHTPAVATTIAGQSVTVQVCLWRDQPYRENCTPEIP